MLIVGNADLRSLPILVFFFYTLVGPAKALGRASPISSKPRLFEDKPFSALQNNHLLPSVAERLGIHRYGPEFKATCNW